jgi:hypothetical protein
MGTIDFERLRAAFHGITALVITQTRARRAFHVRRSQVNVLPEPVRLASLCRRGPARCALSPAAARADARRSMAEAIDADDVLGYAAAWRAQGRGVALATVVSTWGSAPAAGRAASSS